MPMENQTLWVVVPFAGRQFAAGFDQEGNEKWNYELPSGVHEKPIEPVTTARLFGKQSQWLVAAADGSVHILGADGKLIDKFNYGSALTGLAGARSVANRSSSSPPMPAWKPGSLRRQAKRWPLPCGLSELTLGARFASMATTP